VIADCSIRRGKVLTPLTSQPPKSPAEVCRGDCLAVAAGHGVAHAESDMRNRALGKWTEKVGLRCLVYFCHFSHVLLVYIYGLFVLNRNL
jgi:hypothetical protein